MEITTGKLNLRQIMAWFIVLITFPVSGALTMTAISLVMIGQLPPEYAGEPLGIALGFFAIVVGADVGNRFWNYHAPRTGVLRQEVAEQLQRNRELPKILANYEFTQWQLVLLCGYTWFLAVWVPWIEVPVAWRWLNAGIICIPLIVAPYTLLRKYFRDK